MKYTKVLLILSISFNLFVISFQLQRYDNFGKRKIINMSGCGQAKVDLYKRYANKLDKFFGKGSEPVLYKFKVNCTKECRVAYFVDDKKKIIYVTDNIEHIDKGEKH